MPMKPLITGAALAGLLAAASTAQAAYFTDGTLDRMYRLNSPYGANWVDRVGGSQFELFGVDVQSSTDNGGTMNLSLFTNHGLKTENQFQTRTADIAFKLAGSEDFNFGLVLMDHGTGGRKDDNNLGAGFYDVSSWKTSEDIFGDLGSVANNQLTPDNELAAYRIDVSMTGVQDLFGPSWEMMWGNALCANDTIFVSGVGIPTDVSEPAALGLMTAGLLGFGAARRKRKADFIH